MRTILWSILAVCSLITSTLAQSNGMDMSMDVPMDLAVGNMLPYIHFTPGDTLWFLGWVPSSPGAMVGTCIALFLFSLLERWLMACHGLAERHWIERTSISILNKADHVHSLASSSTPSSLPNTGKPSWHWLQLPPFVFQFDLTRGILFGAHAFFKVFLMMAVMTFQLGFIFSIVIGSGVGEMLFGRFALSSHEH